jgi:hypothetical protein
MAGARAMILLNIIAAGAAYSLPFYLRFFHIIFHEYHQSEGEHYMRNFDCAC